MKRDLLSRTASLKVFVGIASIPTAALMITASFPNASIYQSLVCYILSDAFIASSNASVFLNPLLLSKNFSGTLYGVANTLGTIGMGSMLVLLGAFKETVTGASLQYLYTMLLTTGLLLVNFVLYALWAEGTVQEFDEEAEKSASYQAVPH